MKTDYSSDIPTFLGLLHPVSVGFRQRRDGGCPRDSWTMRLIGRPLTSLSPLRVMGTAKSSLLSSWHQNLEAPSLLL